VPVDVVSPHGSDVGESARWDHTALRRRLLDGTWDADAKGWLRKLMGSVRSDAYGDPDLSANPFSTLTSQLACLYDQAPEVSHGSDADNAERMGLLLDSAGLWPRMQTIQRYTLGLREMLVRPDFTVDDGLTLRPVWPDKVTAEAAENRPDVPVEITEYRKYLVDGKWTWVRDTWSVRDPLQPYRRMVDHTTDKVVLSYDASEYPYWNDGRAVLPYVLYHARVGDRLWSPFHGRELVEGTLRSAVHWTFFGHGLRNASWPQRYVAGFTVPSNDTGTRDAVVADPSTILMLEPLEELQGGGQVGSFDVPFDPTVLIEATEQYERNLAKYAGVSASDFQRMSGDPRSGYALSISAEGRRKASQAYEPAARDGDLALLSLIAVMHNRVRPSSKLPTDGWGLRYRALPPTATELQSRRQHVLELLREGLMSRVEAYAEIHDVDESTARTKLAAIDQARAAAANAF
jgi:hypothetical protein